LSVIFYLSRVSPAAPILSLVNLALYVRSVSRTRVCVGSRERSPEEAKDSIASAGRPLIRQAAHLSEQFYISIYTKRGEDIYTYRHRFIFVHLIVLFERQHDTSHRLIDDAFAADIDARKTFVMGADPSLTHRRVTNQLAGRTLINIHAVE